MTIQTFVFFDIETTGLPQYERNRTKITELTCVTVSRRNIETCIGLPLVNKLTLLFNPERKIQEEASRITGIRYSNLKYEPTFKNRIDSLNSFLEHLPKPVCLVAHNGYRFDFKILKAEYNDAGKELPNDLLCVDSMVGFRKILKDKDILLSHRCMETYPDIQELNSNCVTDDEDWPELNTSAEEWEEIDRLTESFSNLLSNSDKSIESSRKVVQKEEKICYKLTELYKRFYNKNPLESHRAEADCVMLLECVLAVREHFLSWADDNCKLLCDIAPLVRK